MTTTRGIARLLRINLPRIFCPLPELSMISDTTRDHPSELDLAIVHDIIPRSLNFLIKLDPFISYLIAFHITPSSPSSPSTSCSNHKAYSHGLRPILSIRKTPHQNHQRPRHLQLIQPRLQLPTVVPHSPRLQHRPRPSPPIQDPQNRSLRQIQQRSRKTRSLRPQR